MSKFRKILVGLGLAPFDEQLVRFASFLKLLLNSETIEFIYIVKDEEVEDNQIDHSIQPKILELIDNNFPANGASTKIEIRSATPLSNLPRMTFEQQINLILLRSKYNLFRKNILADELIEQSACSLLLLPEEKISRISKILVPVDFSAHSKEALKSALQMAANSNDIEVSCLHVYGLPPLSEYQGSPAIRLTYGRMASEIEQDVRTNMNALLKDYDFPSGSLQTVFLPDTRNNAAQLIHEYAQRKKVDLIIIGFRGNSRKDEDHCGSVTREFLKSSKGIAIWIQKLERTNSSELHKAIE